MSPAKPERSKKPGKPVKSPKQKVTPSVKDVVVAPARTEPANRVTIALPFSQIRTQEPSVELADLVTVVGELVTALQDSLRPAQYEDLQAQIDSLRARLR